jgi:hypothetical protein
MRTSSESAAATICVADTTFTELIFLDKFIWIKGRLGASTIVLFLEKALRGTIKYHFVEQSPPVA